MFKLTRLLAGTLAGLMVLGIGSLGAGCLGRNATSVALAQAAAPPLIGQRLSLAAEAIDAAVGALGTSDVAMARARYGEYDDAWDDMEGEIREPYPDVYDTVERAMDRVGDVLLKVDSPSIEDSTAAMRALRQVIDAQAARLG